MTGNHFESDLAEVTSRQTSPVTLCRFALMKKIFDRVGWMLSPLGPSRFSCEVRVLFGLSEPTGLQPLRSLFIAFGIAERVAYSTIKKLSGDSLRAKGHIHQLVRDWSQATVSRAAGKAGEEVLSWTRTTFLPEDFHGKSEVHTKRVRGMMRAFRRDGRSGPIMVLS